MNSSGHREEETFPGCNNGPAQGTCSSCSRAITALKPPYLCLQMTEPLLPRPVTPDPVTGCAQGSEWPVAEERDPSFPGENRSLSTFKRRTTTLKGMAQWLGVRRPVGLPLIQPLIKELSHVKGLPHLFCVTPRGEVTSETGLRVPGTAVCICNSGILGG